MHEPSSPARTLGSWVQIHPEAWMSVCVYSVCVVLCVGSGLATDWSPVQGPKGCKAIEVVRRATDWMLWSHVFPSNMKFVYKKLSELESIRVLVTEFIFEVCIIKLIVCTCPSTFTTIFFFIKSLSDAFRIGQKPKRVSQRNSFVDGYRHFGETC
jgi:hypothetical protein